MKKAVTTQKSYYDDKKHRDVQFTVGDSVLLSTQNLRIKGHSAQTAAEVLWPL